MEFISLIVQGHRFNNIRYQLIESRVISNKNGIERFNSSFEITSQPEDFTELLTLLREAGLLGERISLFFGNGNNLEEQTVPAIRVSDNPNNPNSTSLIINTPIRMIR